MERAVAIESLKTALDNRKTTPAKVANATKKYRAFRMAKSPNIAASVRQRLLNLLRKNENDFCVVLISYALERLIYRLSVSEYKNSFILKGGMLVTLWTKDQSRFTRDVDFLGLGAYDEYALIKMFRDILSTEIDDGLVFDTAELKATGIRGEQDYGGYRLKTQAYLDRARIDSTGR